MPLGDAWFDLVKEKDIEGCKTLVVNGTDVNEQSNIRGWTKLMVASYNGEIEIVKMLLGRKGINVNIQSVDGFTALIRASQKGHLDIVKLLLKVENINTSLSSVNGASALSLASSADIKLLLEDHSMTSKIVAPIKDLFYGTNTKKDRKVMNAQ